MQRNKEVIYYLFLLFLKKIKINVNITVIYLFLITLKDYHKVKIETAMYLEFIAYIKVNCQ